ncbi:hypothetical protein [Luteitalea sp.]
MQREFAESLAAQVPRIAARGGEVRVLDELDRYQAVAPTPDAADALAAEAAEFRRLQGAVAFRALARGDAWLRTRPWIQSSHIATSVGVTEFQVSAQRRQCRPALDSEF